MTFTPEAKALLKDLEGCRLTAYRDQGGLYTIGYGHTADVQRGDAWTHARAEAALDDDLARFEAGVRRLLGIVKVNPNQFSALVIFAFNVGVAGLAGSTALRLIHAGFLDRVPTAMALWNKVTDRSGVPMVNQILVKRREAEGQLWNTPLGIA